MANIKQAAPKTFNFGDLTGYSSGGGVPEGDYALEFTVAMYQAKKQDGSDFGPERLGVIITLTPLAGGEKRDQFYSMGGSADKSWAPNPETGKGIIAVPGGPGITPNASTNWAFFVKSLFDSGLPQGILGDDLSVLDGVHVHMANVPEPKERQGFQTKTGEGEEPRKNQTIAVVTEIKDDGKPWEGTGGVPTAEAPAPTKTVAKPGHKAVPAKTAPAAPVAAEASEDDEGDAEQIGQSAATDVLTANPKGLLKLQLRTGMFAAVKKAHDPAVANSVINHYFSSDDELNNLLGPLGYVVKGPKIEVA